MFDMSAVIKADSKRRAAIGYARVSTPKQATDGSSLEKQRLAISDYCTKNGFQLIYIEEDIFTGVGDESHRKRLGFQKAIRLAREYEAAIIVTKVCRLGREIVLLEDIEGNDIPVYSSILKRKVGKRKSKELLKKENEHHKDLISRAKSSKPKATERGKSVGNYKNLDEVRKKGCSANIARADKNTRGLADFIKVQDDWFELSNKQKVERLNAEGLLNLKSTARNHYEKWTLGSLRKPLKRAEEMILEEAAFQKLKDLIAREKHKYVSVPRLEEELSCYEKDPGFGEF